ncbi:hypothetical protein DP115_10000, partial [Brasilonema octagenarum UFV-OR1]|nr:hypothetical protein [Brasilonema octagenarum UFV-OR1]
GGSFSGEASPENVPWEPPQGAALGTEVAHEGNPTKSAGLTRCLGRETLIKHWSHQIKPDSYNS